MKIGHLRSLLSKEYEDAFIKKQEQFHNTRQSLTRQSHTRSKKQFFESPEPSPTVTKKQVDTNYQSQPLSRASMHQKKTVQVDQEKFAIKQHWRHLMRWQGFDDYIYFRDPKHIKFIKSGGTLQSSDLVEPLVYSAQSSSGHGHAAQNTAQFSAEGAIQVYKEQTRKQQLQDIKRLYQPGEANYTKFNPQAYKQQFVHEPEIPPREPHLKHKELLDEAQRVLKLMNERIVVEEIISISPLGERLVRVLWKLGVFNFYLLSVFIHNYILQVYGKEKLALSNWKKMLRICNMQGHSNHRYKLVAYKHISKICLKLQMYDKCLTYLKKMLKLSWIYNNTNYEIFTYDQISLCYYYRQNMQYSVFFHEKFTSGEYEDKNSGIRNVGEQAYLLGVKLKEGTIDQNSYSEDDLDLEMIVHSGSMSKWENSNKMKDVKEQFKKIHVDYQQGHSFGKIKRATNSEIDFKHSMKKMNDYQAKQAKPLGPIFQKVHIEETLLQKVKKQPEMNRSSTFLFNQKSTNRVAYNFLLQEELKDQPSTEQFSFKPLENVHFLKKMMRVFEYDLKFYSMNYNLFPNGPEFIM